jgi:dipicolinate synthase subunit B
MHQVVLQEIKKLKEKGHNVLPIFSLNTASLDTRFGKAVDFRAQVEEITGNSVIDTLMLAEPIGPKNMIDILVIAPCTGNTLSKLANAITDTAPTMVAKAHMRNNKPVVVGISTNDGLGLNMTNLARLMATKNIYFVPFRQDDYLNKPKSLVADFTLLDKTIESALSRQQLQPIIAKGADL